MASNDTAQLNALLQWGVENSDGTRGTNPDHPPPTRGLNAQTLNSLFGGPSDADLLKESMHVIQSPDATLENKMIAFDNFEQMVESLDNANNLESLGLWTPLLEQLHSTEPDMRRMAAWCVGTAVQNNVKSQERLLAMDGVGKLAKLAVEEADQAAKKKCIYALSSSMRNYQPATNEAVKYLPRDIVQADQLSATDMDKIDEIMSSLRLTPKPYYCRYPGKARRQDYVAPNAVLVKNDSCSPSSATSSKSIYPTHQLVENNPPPPGYTPTGKQGTS